MPESARQIALNILNQLWRSQAVLDGIMEARLNAAPWLSRQDRGLVSALVFGVVRWRERLDWIIKHFSRTPLRKIDLEVMNILRLGLFQVIFMDRIPAAAAVNSAVELAKGCAAPWTVRFVNAVLRKGVANFAKVPFPSPAQDPLLALSVGKAFPRWIVRRWLNRYGLQETGALCDAFNRIPAITVRANTLKATRQDLQYALSGHVQNLESTAWAPDGLRFQHPALPIAELPPFASGLFQVQDEAAQLVSLLLEPQPGERVLDACAGLGGKTGHIAQLMQNQGELWALDNIPAKLRRLESEMQRLGVSIVSTFATDLRQPLDQKKLGVFDRVLLDAPCSGLGVLRRNPDIKWSLAKKNLKRYQAVQLLLLRHLAPLVKPGGRLVFAVCSLEPEENTEVLHQFSDQHAAYRLDKSPHRLLGAARRWLDADGCLRTLPHHSDMDGFFVARLRRSG